MGTSYMGEVSPMQDIFYRKLPLYEKTRKLIHCNPMSKDTNIEHIRSLVAAEMNKRGYSPRGISVKAGLGTSAVRDLLGRVDDPRISTLNGLAEALDIPFSHLAGGGMVLLVGKIGAGGRVVLYEDCEEDQEMVARPPLAHGPVIALEVFGDSMLPKYENGDVVYVRREHNGVLPEYLGTHCAVHLADGGTYLKILTQGTVEGRYTLRSLNAADMENEEVIWASPVLFIMPRSAR